jgi:hypothetical protein
MLGDGYPFDPRTQMVRGDTLRLDLSEDQMEVVSASGVVAFTDVQLDLVKRFYPKAAKLQEVVAATFNDNHEGLSDEDVYIFWVAADEIAVTLNAKVLASQQLGAVALAPGAEDRRAAPRNLRIGPSGDIYNLGKKISLQEAREVITAAKGAEPAVVSITVAPPFRWLPAPLLDKGASVEAYRKLVASLFETLQKHGGEHQVGVQADW